MPEFGQNVVTKCISSSLGMKAFSSTNEEICALVDQNLNEKFNEKMQIESERKSDTASSNLSDVANF